MRITLGPQGEPIFEETDEPSIPEPTTHVHKLSTPAPSPDPKAE